MMEADDGRLKSVEMCKLSIQCAQTSEKEHRGGKGGPVIETNGEGKDHATGRNVGKHFAPISV